MADEKMENVDNEKGKQTDKNKNKKLADAVEKAGEEQNVEKKPRKKKSQWTKASQMERTIHFLDYLKMHTDDNNVATLDMIRDYYDNERYGLHHFGDRNTMPSFAKKLCRLINDGKDTKKEYRVLMNADSPISKKVRGDVKNVYYNQPYSYEEMDLVIEAIRFSKTLDTQTAENLITKLKQNMTSEHYKDEMGAMYKVKELNLGDKKLIRDNIQMINQAISRSVKIEFYFNGYDNRKNLVPATTYKYEVTPFYIVAYAGRYYMIASMYKSMSIWRIDLMTGVDIPKGDTVTTRNGFKGDVMREVKRLPQKWEDDFLYKHLNMSYDEPVPVKLRIRGRRNKRNEEERYAVDYTFLYDWFGDSFTVDHRHSTKMEAIVVLECSPFGMAHWAMQYSDQVEVLEPLEIRNKVKELLRDAVKRYGIEE